MASEIQDLYMEQGADYSLTMRLKGFSGEPVNFDDYTIRGSIRIDGNLYPMDFAELGDGYVDIQVPALVTQTIPYGIGKYDIELIKDSTAKVRKVMRGRFYIEREVTV